MKRFLCAIGATALACLSLSSTAAAQFGFNAFDVTFTNAQGESETQAGFHPGDLTTTLEAFTEEGFEGPVPTELLKDLNVLQIPGLAGDLTATPRCATLDFFARPPAGGHANATGCSNATAVGTTQLFLGGGEASPPIETESPVYNLEPSPGKVARLGFVVIFVPVTIDIGISEDPPYSPYAQLTNVSQVVEFLSSEFTVWGVPADPSHDKLRGTCMNTGKSCGAGIVPRPFLTMPRSCEGPLKTIWEADSWIHPGAWVDGFSLTHNEAIPPAPQGMGGCGKLAFDPSTRATPSTTSAESASGLDFEIDVSDEGLKNPEGLAKADISAVKIDLPVGVTANPSAAEGLDVCTKGQYDAESLTNRSCPDAAKLGTIEAETPLLQEHPVKGSLYLARQDDPATGQAGAENPFDSLLALYMIIRDPALGIFIKLPVKVEPDPKTGRLVATTEDLPPFPLSHVNVHMRSGPRAPLITPPACGTYTTNATLTPSSGADPLLSTSSFAIDSGPGGGPCPSAGTPPFDPGFEAGSLANTAGRYSPFSMRLTRRDGEQELTRFSATLPPGMVGKLAGVAKCADSAIEAAKSRNGRDEQAAPSCPANSKIGSVTAGAGVGTALTWVPGSLYLAGPYNGAPLSVAAIVPAVAGPFDVGTVVTRVALDLNPKTAEVQVDGERSDPIPHILKGLPLVVRDIRVDTDRPDFTLNPTSCEKMSTRARIFGSGADVFSSADDSLASPASPFQASSCASLGLKPKLAFKLGGGTRRGAHPVFNATYTPKPGDANLEGLVVRLPRSAFLDQGHIRTICTRVQFAQDACPPAAQYGFIKAFTPLLDEPLQGPVWLRSSDHNLPDLVFDLHGLVDVEVSTRIDSKNGGIRASIEGAPDAPISKVLLTMQGGKKGLIVNSRGLCSKPSKAGVQFAGQNGRTAKTKPVMRASCG
jgi:hypothetical protein